MPESQNKPQKGLNISAKSFLTAIAVILLLMIVCYILTFIVPGGSYARAEDGTLIRDSFTEVEGGIPFWKWLLSPFLVLGASGNTTLIAVLIFLIVIGGVFSALNTCGLMRYMLDMISAKFGKQKYRLMAAITFFFMALGSLIGSFEECVPLVPIVVALAVRLGWDVLTGFSMSLLAVGCGFAAGVFNPFTVGVAQKTAGLPMFSGAWLRLIAFVGIYALLFAFTYRHAKKIGSHENETQEETAFLRNEKMSKGLLLFGVIFGVGILLVLSSAFVPALQDYTMIIVAVTFLTAGVAATLASGMPAKALGQSALSGIVGMLPAVLMILMASSIKYTLETAHILDTILHGAVGMAETLPRFAVILFVYLIVLAMNFFIASGSAKAIMLIPLIVPLAQVFSIPAQLCVLAFAFGDGFSNVFYPTNPVLLISLGLVDMSYGKWIKWSWKFQLTNLLFTSLLLLFGLLVGYH